MAHISGHRIDNGLKKSERERLRLVKNNHTPAERVKLAAFAGAIGEHRLKQLNVGSHDNRRIPILTSESGVLIFAGSLFVNHTMMLNYVGFAEYVAQYARGLNNYAREWNSNNDSFFSMSKSMIYSPYHRGYGFAPSGGYCEVKEAGGEM